MSCWTTSLRAALRLPASPFALRRDANARRELHAPRGLRLGFFDLGKRDFLPRIRSGGEKDRFRIEISLTRALILKCGQSGQQWKMLALAGHQISIFLCTDFKKH